MRIKWFYIIKMSFALFLRFLGQKSEDFERWNNEKNDEKEMFLREKKRFHPFKSLLHKNGKVQNMPVVDGCLVFFLSCFTV